MEMIREAVNGLQMGEVLRHEGLALFPLMAGDAAEATERDYMVLDEAIQEDLIEITEVDAAGRVPDLKVRNRAKKPVLILDGEELMGAKQNRILDITVLVPAEQEILIPVSCVEQGRWHSKSRRFAPAGHLIFSELRASKKRRTLHAMSLGDRPRDQLDTWDEVGRKFEAMCFRSPTEAVSELYSSRKVDLDSYVKALAPRDAQVGAVFAVHGRVIGMELFDHPRTLRLFLPKVVRSYALDDLHRESRKAKKARPEEAERFLHAMAVADAQPFLGMGLGECVHVRGEGFDGSALAFQGRVVHLSAFTNQAG